MKIKHLWVCASLLMLLTDCRSQKARGQKTTEQNPAVDSPAVESDPIKGYSENLHKLFREAQNGTSKRIEIARETVDPSHPAAFQGNTRYGTDTVEIRVVSGISKDHDEALLAHELFHVVLYNKGFSAGVAHTNYSIQGVRVSDFEQTLSQTGTAINSCFADELIDRETARRGFKPKLLTDLEAKENLDQIAKIANDSDLAIRTHTILQQSAALTVFCLAIRHPSTTDAMDKADAKLTPNIVKFEKILFQQFKNSRCQVNDPKGCFALTLRLRDASGFSQIVALKNPATNEWE
jgi:hypothetical protein